MRLLTYEPLTEIDGRIIDHLRRSSCGFNELCRELEKHISRSPLKKRLDNLVEMGLVDRRKAKRRGQKDLYVLTETSKRFEEKAKRLKMMWDNQFDKLGELEKHVEHDFTTPKKAGLKLVGLIYEALPLLASGLIESQLPSEAKKKLLRFSADRFCSFWESIRQLGERHPEISQGFREGCKELAAHAKRFPHALA